MKLKNDVLPAYGKAGPPASSPLMEERSIRRRENKVKKVMSDIRDAIKDKYELEYFQFHQYRYRFILEKIVKLRLGSGVNVLDVGCYPPHLFNAFQKLGYSVYGISSSHEPIKALNITVLNVEKDILPYKDGFFDLIIFSETMEHLVINPLIYLSKFKRVLSKKGKLLITTPNSAGLHKIIPIFFGRSTYFPLSELFSTELNDGSIYHRHNREYTMAEMAHVLEKAGFSIKSRAYFNAYRSYEHAIARGKPSKQVIRLVTFALTNIWGRLRDSIYIEAGV